MRRNVYERDPTAIVWTFRVYTVSFLHQHQSRLRSTARCNAKGDVGLLGESGSVVCLIRATNAKLLGAG